MHNTFLVILAEFKPVLHICAKDPPGILEHVEYNIFEQFIFRYGALGQLAVFRFYCVL